jgi:hypothetical protein
MPQKYASRKLCRLCQWCKMPSNVNVGVLRYFVHARPKQIGNRRYVTKYMAFATVRLSYLKSVVIRRFQYVCC